jgi:hypothetical protein
VPWFRVSLAVAFLLVASLTSLGPAAAGGPTSALLSVPGAGKTASLYYTDPEYDALARLVGIDSDTGTGEVDRSGRSHDNGPGVTVTWLIHDVSPWRVDHIYPDGRGAPWIATQVVGAGGAISDSPVVWHQPESGAELMALLDDLGVGEAARAADDFSGVAGAPVPPPAEPAADEPAPAEKSGIAGVWWALGGLAAGVLATLLGIRLRGGQARPVQGGPAPNLAVWGNPAPEPHDTDAPPAPDPGDADAGNVVAEELSWPTPRR